jgi:hypothetical protein
MNSTSAAHDDDTGSLAGAAWRAGLLLAGASVLTGLAVSLGLLTAFGPSPDRHTAEFDAPVFRGSCR